MSRTLLFDPSFSMAAVARGLERSVRFSEQGRRARRDFHGAMLLAGPPGVGKTQLAMGLCNEWCRNSARRGQLFVVNADVIPSAEHGGTQKNLARCWNALVEASKSVPTFVVFNEIERLASERSELSATTNPADTMFAVAGMFDQLDFVLSKATNLHVLATTNYSERVDQAFAERVDLIFTLPLPSYPLRLQILANALEFSQPQLAAVLRLLVDKPLNVKTNKQMLAATHGMSPRELTKVALQAELTATAEQLTVKDLLYAAVARRRSRT